MDFIYNMFGVLWPVKVKIGVPGKTRILKSLMRTVKAMNSFLWMHRLIWAFSDCTYHKTSLLRMGVIVQHHVLTRTDRMHQSKTFLCVILSETLVYKGIKLSQINSVWIVEWKITKFIDWNTCSLFFKSTLSKWKLSNSVLYKIQTSFVYSLQLRTHGILFYKKFLTYNNFTITGLLCSVV